MISLEGKVALITGASSGIGRATALRLAQAGACLGLVGRKRQALFDVAAMANTQALCIEADLVDDAAPVQIQHQILNHFGRLDVLVHSAGVLSIGSIKTTPVHALVSMHNVNLRAPYELTRLLLPALEQQAGQIVFINSSAGVNASQGTGAYSSSKHALRSLADCLRHEVNRSSVRVLSVFPGRVASPMQQKLFETEGRPYHPERLLQPEDVAEVVVTALRLSQTAEVTDIHIRPLKNHKA